MSTKPSDPQKPERVDPRTEKFRAVLVARVGDEPGKISQNKLSELLGGEPSRPTIGAWINGQRSPRLSELYRLADALNVPICDLIGEQPEPAMTQDQAILCGYARALGMQRAQAALYALIPRPGDSRLNGNSGNKEAN
jgi:transcriptional regulator with XRE-family HTH domain